MKSSWLQLCLQDALSIIYFGCALFFLSLFLANPVSILFSYNLCCSAFRYIFLLLFNTHSVSAFLRLLGQKRKNENNFYRIIAHFVFTMVGGEKTVKTLYCFMFQNKTMAWRVQMATTVQSETVSFKCIRMYLNVIWVACKKNRQKDAENIQI